MELAYRYKYSLFSSTVNTSGCKHLLGFLSSHSFGIDRRKKPQNPNTLISFAFNLSPRVSVQRFHPWRLRLMFICSQLAYLIPTPVLPEDPAVEIEIPPSLASAWVKIPSSMVDLAACAASSCSNPEGGPRGL